jgi:dipeptidyl aminopeptidase/acylaminoacyl peptidase
MVGMAERVVAPYGAWPSPISATEVARGGIGLQFARPVGDEVWWSEQRPDEAGRVVVVRRDPAGRITDVLPAGWNARTRVHEYGGLAWLPVPTATGADLVFAAWTDQRLYRVAPGSATPSPLTPDPAAGRPAGPADGPTAEPAAARTAEPAAWRYADPVLSPNGREVWCVREAHDGGRIRRALVAVPLDGAAADDPTAIHELVSGSDFLAFPRPSPDGRRLAWVAWDHPRMPWDGTELRVAAVGPDGKAGAPRTVLGGPAESVLQPEWADAESLYAVSDRSGWWNLYRVPAGGGAAVPLYPREEEFSEPLWLLGMTRYAILGDGRLAVTHGTDSLAIGVLDPATGELADLDLPFTFWSYTLRARGGAVVGVAGSSVEAPAVVEIETATGAVTRLRRSLDVPVGSAYLPVARSITAPAPAGRHVHAHVFAPANPDATAPDGELPPYVVFVHGGPTSHVPAVLSMERAFFTSRGIGVIDVNYGGSAGYGRAYRELLRGQWGVVDVEDCVAAVHGLVESGDADGARLAIRGGSAGGWTTLAALTRTDAFAAGTSRYGVADLLRFAAETHDFESRYLDGLVGVLPAERDRYVERAPLSHVDQLSCPVLLLQGLEDRVVPPSQAELFAEALARNRIPHAYLAFPGEQHGFRRAENIITALEAELSFYGQVLGFTPPGIPVLPLVTGEPGTTSEPDGTGVPDGADRPGTAVSREARTR